MATKQIAFSDLILFENDHITVIDKPGDMASLDDKSALNVQELAKGHNPELRLCHRLDKQTSGALILAKDDEAYRHLALQFQHREVKKEYLALVAGVQQFDQTEIDLPILVSTNKKVFINKREGKPAQTIISTEEVFRSYTLLRCQPVTGRMHQIRIHLSSQGIPIVGDHLYGGEDLFLSQVKRKYKPSGRREERPLNHGFLLHAAAVSFRLPKSGELIRVEAPLPQNFEVVLKQLDKHNR